jgi:alpha-galactosidase
MIHEIQLRYVDQAGAERVLRLRGPGRSAHDGIALSARARAISGGEILHATVHNQAGEPVQMKWLSFELDTGFDNAAAARFFKHGYQSWSPSYPAVVGHAAAQQARSSLARISHQSEAQRPAEAPESATSELFTIAESSSCQERFLCGFIGGANQFTTITMVSPDRASARALFDDIWLSPGQTVAVEPLAYWRSDQEAARMAARWAELLGVRMSARTTAPYQRGWCSWYYYFDAITEDALRLNLKKLKTLRGELGIDVVQLDDGFQAALGDWERTNAKFPSGLKRIASEIRDSGFAAGLWTAPFLATRDSNLMQANPDWLIRDHAGQPLAAAYNPAWSAADDKSAYALDPSHPEFAKHLKQLYRRIVDESGYTYLKLDFLFAAAVEGRRHDANLTRAQTLRRGLDAIRRGAGPEAFIVGCGCPLGPAVGIVDGMRIGPDVAPYWGTEVKPGARLAINAIVARSFMHRRLWLNDPDCALLRARETHLSHEERFALAAAIAVSGGMLLVSDDVSLLDAESERLHALAAGIGLDVDRTSGHEPPIAKDLMCSEPMQTLVSGGAGSIFYLLLNLGEITQHISTPAKPNAGRRATLIGPDGEIEAPEKITLPPHSGRIIRC